MDEDEETRALGQVPVTDRGSLPFALLRGESLVAIASWALESAGVHLVDFDVRWPAVRAAGAPLVLHDPLCPLVPPAVLAEAVRAAGAGAVVVGVRPVTDTIKSTDGDLVGDTVDRESLLVVASPVVLPASVVAELAQWPDTADFGSLVGSLRARFDVAFLTVPPEGRRIHDESDLRLLAALADQADQADRSAGSGE